MSPQERPSGADLQSTGHGAVVTPHLLASATAADILGRGGNAVDAAIAANATLGVVAPETCGIGGDLFALVHTPGDAEPATLNSSGRAGRGGRAELLREHGDGRIPIDSPFAVTVPGCVDGWVSLAERFGSMSLESVLSPAIDHATNGFAASAELAGSLSRFADTLAPQRSARGLYRDGSAPAIGDTVSRPDLAATLAAIGANGRAAFYSGAVADAIVDATKGVLHHVDLERGQADWIDPVSVDVMGWTGWTIPPNSQGYLTLAAAWIFEQLDPPQDPIDPRFTHAAIEAFRSVAWERDNYVADSDFAPVAAHELVSPSRLGERVEAISMQSRANWPTPSPAAGGTAYLCVRDTTGMGVSLIQSNYHGIGSRIGAGDAGFFLHDRGSNFSLEPGHPNELAPGKRPLHTLSPTLWTHNNELEMLLGTRGGDFQPQTLLQVLTYMRWAGLGPVTAQRMPRWTTDEWRTPDSTVVVEPHMDSSVQSDLAKRGHSLRVAKQWMGGWGPVSVIAGKRQAVVGAADPRVATTAAIGV